MIIVNTKTDTERQVSRQRERYLLRAIDKYLQRERERERESKGSVHRWVGGTGGKALDVGIGSGWVTGKFYW